MSINSELSESPFNLLTEEILGAGFETDRMASVPLVFDDGQIIMDRLNKIQDITLDMIGGMERDMETIIMSDTPIDESLYFPDQQSLARFSDQYDDYFYSQQ